MGKMEGGYWMDRSDEKGKKRRGLEGGRIGGGGGGQGRADPQGLR